MRKLRQVESFISEPGGVFRVVQYFNAKGIECRRQYYPVSKKKDREANSAFPTKSL